MTDNLDPHRARARLSLEGLSLGDAFGERFFLGDAAAEAAIGRRALPDGRWRWTDDTAMAITITDELVREGSLDADRLARGFARRYVDEPVRGYGRGAREALSAIAGGMSWQRAGRLTFADGSKGNGAAMRSAPLGAFFADDVERVIAEARVSALPTHSHPDAIAGAIAVALAAAYAVTRVTGHRRSELLRFVAANMPAGPVATGIRGAIDLRDQSPEAVARSLGSGKRVLAEDTVPFALWCADRHLGSFEDAMWATVSGLGDRDTTCAIVGGIVAGSVGSAGLPSAWLEHREPLPSV